MQSVPRAAACFKGSHDACVHSHVHACNALSGACALCVLQACFCCLRSSHTRMHACTHTCIHAYRHTGMLLLPALFSLFSCTRTCIHAYRHTCIHAYRHASAACALLALLVHRGQDHERPLPSRVLRGDRHRTTSAASRAQPGDGCGREAEAHTMHAFSYVHAFNAVGGTCSCMLQGLTRCMHSPTCMH